MRRVMKDFKNEKGEIVRGWTNSHRGFSVFLLLVLILPSANTIAQTPAVNVALLSAAARESPHTTAAAENTKLQDYKLSPEKYARAAAYSRAGYWLYFIANAYGLLAFMLFLRWRIAPRLRNWAEGISSRWSVQLLVFAPVLLFLVGLLILPIQVSSQWISLQYKQSVQSWGSWFWDWTMSELMTALFGTLLVGLLYYLIQRRPRSWWFYSWMAAVPIVLLATLLEPVVAEPLFNKFEALEATHPELVASIEKVVAHAGLTIPRDHMYMMMASDKTNEVNAYVAGFGASKRVVLSDTIIAAETGPVILHTLGHEMGHYMLNLDWIAFAVIAPLFLALFYSVHRILQWALARRGSAWDIQGAGDWASLPLLSLIVFVIAFVLTPVSNTLSRIDEHEADRYGLEVIHGIVPNPGEVAAQAFQIEGELNLQDPDPPAFLVFWLFDHPPVNDRIYFCRTYDPWSEGKAPRYVK
jgi:STE24 endopeptidase